MGLWYGIKHGIKPSLMQPIDNTRHSTLTESFTYYTTIPFSHCKEVVVAAAAVVVVVEVVVVVAAAAIRSKNT
ncbi:hypothetical protein ElyMa_004222400 [Elysia marginata]|uniref:Transmembrane protein n=1 Tax=Elysia marginata TaxID=1093978 RepID=A0AAV4GNN7_9GAST|nr:hypothetical protein ElyMa_004222400 [Elysia marginata]